MRNLFRVFTVTLLGNFFLAPSFAEPLPVPFNADDFRPALKLKKKIYISQGSFTAGSSETKRAILTEIKVAKNPEGYVRWVLTSVDNVAGETGPLSIPPYTVVENRYDERKTIVTLFGNLTLKSKIEDAVTQAKKTGLFEDIDLLPVLEKDRWTFTIRHKKQLKLEVFQLSNPARVVLDFLIP